MVDDITSAPLNVDSATSLIAGLLSETPVSEDKRARETAPEQSPQAKEPVTATQAPAAPGTSESEQAETPESEPSPDEGPEATAETPQTYKTTIDGQEVEVTLEEALKGYSRTADYTKKTQALAAQKREFEDTERRAVQVEREKIQQALTALEQAQRAAMPKEPDWQMLRQSVSADVYAAERDRWDQHVKDLAEVQSAQAALKAKQDEDAQRGFQQYVEMERAKLVDALPAYGDPKSGDSLKAAMNAFAKSRGFTDDDLNSVTDHRMVLLLHDAMQGAKARADAKAKAPDIKTKLEQAIAPTQPGASRSTNPQKSKLAAAMDRQRKTGREDDTIAAITALLG